MVASQTDLEADFASAFFHNDVLVLVGVICVVQLGDLVNDPHDLSVELLLDVCVQDIRQLVLPAHQREHKDIPK